MTKDPLFAGHPEEGCVQSDPAPEEHGWLQSDEQPRRSPTQVTSIERGLKMDSTTLTRWGPEGLLG